MSTSGGVVKVPAKASDTSTSRRLVWSSPSSPAKNKRKTSAGKSRRRSGKGGPGPARYPSGLRGLYIDGRQKQGARGGGLLKRNYQFVLSVDDEEPFGVPGGLVPLPFEPVPNPQYDPHKALQTERHDR